MKNIFSLLLLIFLLISCNKLKRKEKKTIYNKNFKWTISIPKGFDTLSSEVWEKMQNSGAEKIEKVYETKIESKPKTIFVLKVIK